MSLSYLDAMLIMGLAAEIHGTDAAVKRAAERCAKRVERRYRPVVYNVVNSVSPYMHIVCTIATIPDKILKMDPKRVPPPHVLYAQHKAASEA